ncbi:MAG: GyrI-like domain-containing protein [Bacteroidales bacterium]|nr:GyrI-like domain-containing protein [Bacteroidales bacterium]
MKALKIVIIILVVLIAIILIPPLFMPSQMFVERSAVLKAQPEVIWDQVNCLGNWEKWDVWHQDTNLVGTYEGQECGEGAKNIWNYKDREEGGSQTIVKVRKYEYIKTLLDFQEMGTADAEMMLEKVEEGTKVTWNLRSDSPYPLMRWVHTLMVAPNVKKSYDEGLVNLNELTKDMKLEQPKYTTGEVTEKEVTSFNALVIRTKCTMEEMGDKMGQVFGALMAYTGKIGIQMAGPPFSIWYEYESEVFEFDSGIPVPGKIVGEGDIKSLETYAGKVIHATHTGSYESTQYSWGALQEFITDNGLELNGDPWEVYITDPMSQPDQTKWVTELYWPVK